MTGLSQNRKPTIRPLQHRDLEGVTALVAQACAADSDNCSVDLHRRLQQYRRWYGLFKFLSLFPTPIGRDVNFYVAHHGSEILGLIQVTPFNKTRTTWRVERVITQSHLNFSQTEIGSLLLRHCFEAIWEARTWILEVNVQNSQTLALYRQNGFQPLAQLTYWSISPEDLDSLAQRDPKLPNLLPVSNIDAQLICQLDTVAMPPLLRQVFDRSIQDFKTGLVSGFFNNICQWFSNTDEVRHYVFEPQRKAAIGYFDLKVCTDGTEPHKAELTVHPAYTWLYPELATQMAQFVQNNPPQTLQLVSADYQPEREEYLEKIEAQRIGHTLLMSRSVWHKLREAKPSTLESLQLSEVLQGLQPARTPIPSRVSFSKSRPPKKHPQISPQPHFDQPKSTPSRQEDSRPLSEESN
jgi:hypothetical protein